MTLFFKHSGLTRAFVTVGFLLLAFPRVDLKGESDTHGSTVKVLTVGNSFADDACYYLPAMAEAGGKKMLLVRANLGGHSLDQHVSYLQAYEADSADPKGSPYKAPGSSDEEKKKTNLKAILQSEAWNFVTIQQVSSKSYKESTYEPYAGILIDYIRKNAPTAEILIQQTWAYREDHAFFKNGELTQEKMYEGLRAAYAKLAARYQLRLIPSGDAYQAARKLPRWSFTFPDPAFDYANPQPKTLPDQAGSLNIGWKWVREKNSEELKMELDAIHSNMYGRFLISCVWYEVIFGESVLTNSFIPEGMTSEDANALRQVAGEVVRTEAATRHRR